MTYEIILTCVAIFCVISIARIAKRMLKHKVEVGHTDFIKNATDSDSSEYLEWDHMLNYTEGGCVNLPIFKELRESGGLPKKYNSFIREWENTRYKRKWFSISYCDAYTVKEKQTIYDCMRFFKLFIKLSPDNKTKYKVDFNKTIDILDQLIRDKIEEFDSNVTNELDTIIEGREHQSAKSCLERTYRFSLLPLFNDLDPNMQEQYKPRLDYIKKKIELQDSRMDMPDREIAKQILDMHLKLLEENGEYSKINI